MSELYYTLSRIISDNGNYVSAEKAKEMRDELTTLNEQNEKLRECVDRYAVCDDVGVKARKCLEEIGGINEK